MRRNTRASKIGNSEAVPKSGKSVRKLPLTKSVYLGFKDNIVSQEKNSYYYNGETKHKERDLINYY